MKFKIFLFLFLFTFLLSGINALVKCQPQTISQTFTQNILSTSQTLCSNDGNQSVTISQIGTDFNLSDSSIGSSPSQKTLIISYNPSASIGLHSGSITFSDGSPSVPIAFQVNAPTQSSSCSIDVFPLSLTGIKIQQGETKIRTVTLSNPSCFSSSITINSVALSTDEKPLQLGELSTGILQPGQSIRIPIEINAVGVSTGAYSDTLQFLIYNSSGNNINVPSTSISVLVTSGINPITNFSITQLPTCSLNAAELGLNNNTYSMTCTKNNPNIFIKPIIDNSYITGISVDETSSQYIYNFKAKKIGVTEIRAEFIYSNAVIGEPFSQSIKISNTGNSPTPGTVLNLRFFQNGQEKGVNDLNSVDTIIQVIDNNSRGVVGDGVFNSAYKLYYGGLQMSNNSLFLEPNKIYSIRATASGYNEAVFNISVTNTPIPFTLDPSKSQYNSGETITITSSIANVSYLINDVIMIFPYTLSVGEFIIKAQKIGYTDSIQNISVIDGIFIIAGEKEYEKGDEGVYQLNKNSSWVVFFNGTQINSGVGNIVSFEIKKAGTYDIQADGVSVKQLSVIDSSFWSGLPGWGKGGIIVLGIGILFFVGAKYWKKGSDDVDDIVGAG